MAGADGAQTNTETTPLLSTPTALEWAMRLFDAAGIETPRFEAQLLLALALGVTRTVVVAGLHPRLSEKEFRAFERLVRERERHVPLAYLRGTQEFYGLTFTVTPATLIPRPETELLVEFALEKLSPPHCKGSALNGSRLGLATLETQRHREKQERGKREEEITLSPHHPLTPSPLLVDVGTGTGCIPIAVLANCPEARAIALDLSAEALAVARQNANANGVADRLCCVQGDMLTGVGRNIDLLLSNPPYIPTEEVAGLQPEVRDFEPRLALDGGPDGMTFLRRLAGEARRVLKPNGWLAVEVAIGQAAAVTALFAAQGLTEIVIRRDLAGIERMVCGKNGV